MKFTLLSKKLEAKDTYSFFFKPEKPFNFLAGQYIYLTLPKLSFPDSRGATRHFTISSSPTEKDYVSITTRIRKQSGYKKTLMEIQKDDTLEMEGPNGVFIFDEEVKNPICMLSGGIGITPFRSMLKYAFDTRNKNELSLIYSNKNEDEIAFKTELNEWSKNNKNFKLAMTLTGDNLPSSWKGSRGRIEANMIKNICPVINPTMEFFVCGPNTFVDSMELVLQEAGVSISKIVTEKFTGY